MPIQQMLLGGGPAPEVVGQALLTGEHRSGSSWTVPDGVNYISVLCIGPGAASTAGNSGSSGGGGALCFANSIPVTPGATLTYITATPDGDDNSGLKSELSGPASGSQSAWTLTANGGQNKSGGTRSATGSPGVDAQGNAVGSTPPGGRGGSGYDTVSVNNFGWYFYPGGGGAAGYNLETSGGNGGWGSGCSGWGCTPPRYDPDDGESGGGGGGGLGGGNSHRGGGGGGVAPYGEGSDGEAGVNQTGGNMANGSKGEGGSYVSGLDGGTPTDNTDDSNSTGANGGDFGGGAGANIIDDAPAGTPNPIPGKGCIRIIWPGDSRKFPTTRTANE